MSDYLVCVESFTHTSNGLTGWRIRPLKKVIDDYLYNFPKEELDLEGFSSFIIWNTLQNRTYKNVKDGTYCICRDLEIHLTKQGSMTVIEVNDFERIAEEINKDTSFRQIVKITPPDNLSLKEYFNRGGITIDSPPATDDVYITDGAYIYGPLKCGKNNDGKYQFLAQFVKQYKPLSDISSPSSISYQSDNNTISLTLFNKDYLEETGEPLDFIDDDLLKELYSTDIDLFYKRAKQKNELNQLKAVFKSLPKDKITPERLKRIENMIQNGDDINGSVQRIFVDGFTAFPEETKGAIIDALFSREQMQNHIYNFCKTKKDYKNKIDELIGQYGTAEKIAQYKAEAEQAKQKLGQAKAKTTVDPSTLANNKRLQSENTSFKIKIEQQKEEIEKINAELKKLRESGPINLSDKVIEALKNEQVIQMIEESGTLLDTYFLLKTDNQQKNDSIQALRTKGNELDAEIDRLKEQTKEKDKLRQTATENYFSAMLQHYEKISFDGALSSRMLKAAADYEKKNQTEETKQYGVVTKDRVEQVDENIIEIPPKDLRNIIFDTLNNQANRKGITPNDVSNLLLCFSQGFLTILAGEPGTGKTSLVNNFAEAMGFVNGTYPRYTEIAVEKGWTSKRDLIGYYNPLTKSFDEANGGLYSALQVLNEEAEQSIADYPYLVLLDEANLSQMEYYWADFMGITDMKKSNRKVSLDQDYQIPQTLRFMATINLDHTTETLSPRLIDRAWIIRLEAKDIDFDSYLESAIEYNGMVTFNVIQTMASDDFCNLDNISENVFDRLQQIKQLFRDRLNVNLSPRVMEMLKRYCAGAINIMDMETEYTALDYAVAQKVLPVINGYGDVYADFINNLTALCADMPICQRLLKDIRKKAEVNMQYYQYFAR